ncbi:MAG TPA: flagellar hook-length control protein FliK [Burkholderiaceae bacterium]|nr:flagellar hook-length control protein FliK [Burkholderiaceae bacterium]
MTPVTSHATQQGSVGSATRATTGKPQGQFKAGMANSFAALMLQADEQPNDTFDLSGSTPSAKKKPGEPETAASGADPAWAAPSYPLAEFMQRSGQPQANATLSNADSDAGRPTTHTRHWGHEADTIDPGFPLKAGTEVSLSASVGESSLSNATPGSNLSANNQSPKNGLLFDKASAEITSTTGTVNGSTPLSNGAPNSPPPDVTLAMPSVENVRPLESGRIMPTVGQGDVSSSASLNNSKDLTAGQLAEGRPSDTSAAAPSTAGTNRARLQGWRAGAALSGHVSTVKLATATPHLGNSASAQSSAPSTSLTAGIQQVAAEMLSQGRTGNVPSATPITEANTAITGTPSTQEASSNQSSSDQQPGGQPSGQEIMDAQFQQPSSAATDVQEPGNTASFSEVMSQLTDQVNTLITQGTQTATLTVDADGANPVNIHVTMDDGMVNVTFGAMDTSTLDALKSQAENTLKPMLETQGMTLNQVSVEAQANAGSMGGSGAQTGSGHASGHRPPPGSSIGKTSTSGEPPPRTAPHTPLPSKGRLDLFA